MHPSLPISASHQEVAYALKLTLQAIKLQGETPLLKGIMLYQFGRVLFLDDQPQKAFEVMKECSIHFMNINHPPPDDLYYWVSRIQEAMGNWEKAKEGYESMLSLVTYRGKPWLVDAILDRLALAHQGAKQ